ncbi:hypothetical protein E4T56_gene14731 [Termitomyces sp. T112]|nr:hypothetical protein E4T56_gene14731 [Termitomyces sp. T112]
MPYFLILDPTTWQGAPKKVHHTAPIIPHLLSPSPAIQQAPAPLASHRTGPMDSSSPSVVQPWAPKRADFSTLNAFLGLGQSATPNSSQLKFWDIESHPAQAEAAQLSQEMAAAIRKARGEHWTDWLEGINTHQIYLTNKYVVHKPSNLSYARVPDLKNTVGSAPSPATKNVDKVLVLAESFFPSSPTSSSIPQSTYPELLPGIRFFTPTHIQEVIQGLPPFKALGTDGVPNVVLKHCMDTLIDHLHFIFCTVFELGVYHNLWLVSTTLVLCKPGKPAYDVAKAYCPIGLLNTLGKLLSTLIATDLSFLAEKHSMLPAHQLGGCPGWNTSDALHLITNRIKNA